MDSEVDHLSKRVRDVLIEERAATGAGIVPQQAAIALVALIIAAVCVKKARGPAAQS